MNIVRWLTNHPILSVWALTIVALLLSLGGSGGHKQGGNGDIASKEHVEASSHHETEKPADSANEHVQPAVVAAAESAVNNQVQAAVPAVSVPVNNTVVNAVTNTGATTNKAAPEATTTPSVEAVSTEASAEQQKLATSDLNDKSVDELLLMAREAYWNNGLDEAASIYQELIQREPNVLEHKGELGNVYWRQGFPGKSASLYAEIAIPMIDKGNAERVSNMIGFIGLFHPDKAAEINKHMQSTAK